MTDEDISFQGCEFGRRERRDDEHDEEKDVSLLIEHDDGD